MEKELLVKMVDDFICQQEKKEEPINALRIAREILLQYDRTEFLETKEDEEAFISDILSTYNSEKDLNSLLQGLKIYKEQLKTFTSTTSLLNLYSNVSKLEWRGQQSKYYSEIYYPCQDIKLEIESKIAKVS